MVIYFLGSVKNFNEDLPYYKKIVEVIHDGGNVLARDWIGTVTATGGEKGYRENENIDWTDVHDENVNALKRSDIIIIETTTLAFQQGFFTALALQQKKP